MIEIVKLLKNLNFTISSCESITGGLFAKSITDVSSSSQVFQGAIVAYNNDIKINIVKVNHQIISEFGAISEQCALAMAKNIKKLFKTNIAISFTGHAGPNNIENKPSGLVYIAIIFNDKNNYLVHKFNFKGTRNMIRQAALLQAKLLLKNKLKELLKELPK